MSIKKSSRYSHVADWQSSRQPDREKTLHEEPISPVEVQQGIKQAGRKKESERDLLSSGKKKKSYEEEKEKEMRKDEYSPKKTSAMDIQDGIKSCLAQSTRGRSYSNTGEISRQRSDCTVIDLKA